MTTVSSDIESATGIPDGDSGRRRNGSPSFGDAPSPWRGGLAAARRHTIFVRVLRSVALAVSVIAVGMVLTGTLLAPSQQGIGDLSADRVGFDGTKITLESPKISGFQVDRRPYSIKARRGVQDLSRPHIIELLDIDAGFGAAADKAMQVIAASAQYDSQNELILLNGDVRITSASGYDLSMQSARVDFKAGTLVSDSAVSLKLRGATVAGERMTFDDRSHVITFDGGVKSAIHPGSETDVDPTESSVGLVP